GFELRVRLFNGHVRLQTADDGQKECAARLDAPACTNVDGRPELDAVAGKLEPARMAAEHEVRLPIQANRLPDDGAIAAEATLPQPVAQDRDRRPARGAFGRRER